MYTTEYLAFGKDLLAKLYLTGKVYIPKLLGVCLICNKSHALNEVILFGYLHFWGFLWPWKLTFIEHWINFNSPIFFPRWLTEAVFFTRCLSIFTAIDQKKEEQKSTDQIFLKDVTEEKKLSLCEIHTHSWLSMVWIFKNLSPLNHTIFINYLQSKTTFWAKLTKNHIQ